VQSWTDWPPARSGSFRSPFERHPTTWLNPLLDALYCVRDFARMIMATLGARIPFYPVGLEAQPRITLRLSLAKACYFITYLAVPSSCFGSRRRLASIKRDDDKVPIGLLHDFEDWKLRLAYRRRTADLARHALDCRQQAVRPLSRDLHRGRPLAGSGPKISRSAERAEGR